jgi:curli biogenesis system outer membrane secretion channel CsgG
MAHIRSQRAALVAAALALVLMASSAHALPRLSVRAFDNKAGSDTEAPAAAITDMMVTELRNAKLFTLIEREKLDYVTQEQELAASGMMDPSTAPEMGMIKGARYSMTGAVTICQYNAKAGGVYIPGIVGGVAAGRTGYVTLDIRIIDNQTSEVVYASAKEGKSKEEAYGILSAFGGFGKVEYGGILASAARDSVRQHVAALREIEFDE